ncbi:hypothetical protein TNCV_722821 [Trichonephila clavipes]|nr:hypothetical protein TNCV_722821 [Trichonephila clavipes]
MDDKTSYMNDTMQSFQTSPDSSFSILMAVYLFRSSEETTHPLLALDTGIRALYVVWGFGQPLSTVGDRLTNRLVNEQIGE